MSLGLFGGASAVDEGGNIYTMVTHESTDNAKDLELELEWFAQVLDCRLKNYFDTDKALSSVFDITPPDLSQSHSYYAQFVSHYELSIAERIVILLALIPHIRPQLLDVLWSRNNATERGFTEFGGLLGKTHGGFIPTGETAIFILAGDELVMRFEISRLFEADHIFARHNILSLAVVSAGESALSGALNISTEFHYWFTRGIECKPNYNSDFPARLIETELDWDYLVLPSATLEQLEEIKSWIQYGQQLFDDWGMSGKLRPGYTSLFCGPSGTGKTLSAA